MKTPKKPFSIPKYMYAVVCSMREIEDENVFTIGFYFSDELRLIPKKKPSKPKIMRVKAWAVIEGTGEIKKLFIEKRNAELNVSSYAGEKLVPCTISYSLPKNNPTPSLVRERKEKLKKK